MSTAEVDEFLGPEGVAENLKNLHEVGLFLALLAVQNSLLFRGQGQLAFGGSLGRGVRLGRAREGGRLASRLAVRS